MAAATAIAAHAQADSTALIRAVTSSYDIEAGYAEIADTYLTPLKYTGTHTAFRYERSQPMRLNPARWIMQLDLRTQLDLTENPARNADMSQIALQASWAMMHRWALPAGVTVGLGGAPHLNLGMLYLNTNGNNPVSVKAALTLDAKAYASWSSHINRLKFTLRYQPSLPLTGVFFAPDYGQLYYQIYLGETKGLAHAAWWGNYFAMDNLLTADLHFGNTSLRLGYFNHIFSSKANNIVSRQITHALVLGVTTNWISLSPNCKQINARIIEAY